MISADDVVAIYRERSNAQGAEKQGLREILDLYNGDIAIPLPEFNTSERSAIPNIARQAIDQVAQRIASVFPEIAVSPTSPRKASLAKAADRRRAFYGFHEHNSSQRKMRRRARFLQAYASAPISIGPDFASGLPESKVRNPLSTFAAISGDPDQIVPTDCIFATRQTMGWLKAKHPDAFVRIREIDDSADTAIDILEYVDSEVMWLIATKRERSNGEPWNYSAATAGFTHQPADKYAVLAFAPNRIEQVPVIIPGAITLGEQKSTFHQIIGMYQVAAEFDALSRIAIRNGILPEAWLTSNPNEEAVLERTPNRYTGEPGRVSGGRIEFRTTEPQFASRTGVGDLERAQRLTAGVPAELGGEAASNVRTGKRADGLMSAVLDFPVQEAHQLFEESMEYENELLALCDLRYFRDVPRVFHVNFSGHEKGDLVYTPGELWTKSDGSGKPAVRSKVSYFAAGLDANDRIIAYGQRQGMGTMSRETTMRHDPLVDDVDAERRRILAEEIDRAFLTKIQTLAADPNSPVTAADIGSLKTHVRRGLELEEAWVKVQTEITERQEEAAEAQAIPGAAAPLGPEALEPPGAEVPPSIGAPPESVGNLSQLLTGLRSPAVFATPQG